MSGTSSSCAERVRMASRRPSPRLLHFAMTLYATWRCETLGARSTGLLRPRLHREHHRSVILIVEQASTPMSRKPHTQLSLGEPVTPCRPVWCMRRRPGDPGFAVPSAVTTKKASTLPAHSAPSVEVRASTRPRPLELYQGVGLPPIVDHPGQHRRGAPCTEGPSATRTTYSVGSCRSRPPLGIRRCRGTLRSGRRRPVQLPGCDQVWATSGRPCLDNTTEPGVQGLSHGYS